MQPLTTEAQDIFSKLWHTSHKGGHAPIIFDLPYPKAQFLQYLVDVHKVILHGSNKVHLAEITPFLAGGVAAAQALTAVYATDSAPESIFFAILDRPKVGSFSSSTYGTEYTVDKFTAKAPWCRGMVYILPRESFEAMEGYWVSQQSITPLGTLEVVPDDFPYLLQVKQNRLPYWMKWVFKAVIFWKSRR